MRWKLRDTDTSSVTALAGEGDAPCHLPLKGKALRATARIAPTAASSVLLHHRAVAVGGEKQVQLFDALLQVAPDVGLCDFLP